MTCLTKHARRHLETGIGSIKAADEIENLICAGGSGGDSFSTIQTDAGTYPTADSSTDTLTLTSSDSSITITGNATTDTIDLKATGPKALEEFLAWESSENNAFFTEYTYDGNGDLTDKDVYTDATKATKIFALDYAYTGGGDLDTITTTRVSDATVLLRTFAYTGGGDLLSVTYS